MIIRHAQSSDVDAMARIIGHHAARGLMLPRSRASLLASISQYVVAEMDGLVVACGGLQPYTATLAEIYGLATSPDITPPGTGRAIVEALVDCARMQHLQTVFALTLVPGFFEKLGFHAVEHSALPLKVWKDCVACPKFGNCDEIAMVLPVSGSTNERFTPDNVFGQQVVGR